MSASDDIETLIALPAFQRFLFRVVEAAALLRPTDGDLQRAEGRRALGFEILSWVEDVQAEQHPSGLPVGASIQLLAAVRNESVAKEKPKRGRQARTDRKLLDSGDDGDGDA